MKRMIIASITVLVWIYCGIAFFDPADFILGAKLPVFAMALLLFLLLNTMDRLALPKDLLFRIFLLAFLIPAISLTVFLIRHPGQSLTDSFSLVKGLWAVLLIFPVAAAGVDLRKPVFACIGAMAATILGLRVCLAFNPALYKSITSFLVDYNVARIGSRSFGEIDVVMIFFVTTPLVIISVPFLINLIFGRSNTAWHKFAAVLFLGLILSASFVSAARALTIVLLLECLACFVYLNRRRGVLVAGSLALAAIFLAAGLMMVQKTTLLSSGEQSNSTKIGHFKSFTEYINDHPAVLLTGDGLGATYFSGAPDVGKEVYQTELTYIDMVRYFGLAGSLFILLLLGAPLLLPANNGLLFIGLMSYLIVAGNNPLLFNSTGMLAMVFFWSQQLRYSKNNAIRPTPAPGH
ncbi:MAG: hypothetical protein Q7U71_01895 [bacterium]|nr:hypothetical protein [bacterium]